MFGLPLWKRLCMLLALVSLIIICNSTMPSDVWSKSRPASQAHFDGSAQYQSGTTGAAAQQKSCPWPFFLLCQKPKDDLRGFIDTSSDIHLFQSFDYRISDPSSVAQYFDFIWGGSPRKVAEFHQAHPKLLISYYIPFHRDAGTFFNQDLGKRHSLSYWHSSHPDWILYKCDRRTPAYEFGNPNMPLDFSNANVVRWQVNTYGLPASKQGYDALAADNINMENLFGACGHYQNGHWVTRYTGKMHDEQWRADVVSWVTRMQRGLHNLSRPIALIPNFSLGALMTTQSPIVQQFLDHVDAVLDERGFTKYGQGYITGERWVESVKFIQMVQNQHKAIYILNQTKSHLKKGQIPYALASYLMAKGRLASMYITGDQDYGRTMLKDEYNIQIGNPQGSMYQSQNVYWRDYSGGLVVVNPSDSESYRVRLSDSYRDIYGNRVSHQFTLPPHSGKVLQSR